MMAKTWSLKIKQRKIYDQQFFMILNQKTYNSNELQTQNFKLRV